MSEQTFEAYCTVREGKLSIDARAAREYIEAREGKTIRVTFEEVASRRSGRQQRYYRGALLPLLAGHTGYSTAEMHSELKKKFLDGRSTKGLTVKEMEDYLRQIREFASADLGVFCPMPNEVPGDVIT